MFRIRLAQPPGVGLRRLLLACVVGLNAIVLAAILLVLILGWAGVFWFLCTWPLSGLFGFVMGCLFVPDPKPR